MTEHAELNNDSFTDSEEASAGLQDAIDLASDQGQPTWLTDGDGKRIAAIVPVDVLEDHDRWLSRAMNPRLAAHEFLLAADRALSIPHPAHELSPGAPPCPGAPGEIERWENLLKSIGIRDVEVVSVTHEKAGRVVRLKLPRSGRVTIHTLRLRDTKIAVIMQLLSRDVTFRERNHAGDVELRLNESRK